MTNSWKERGGESRNRIVWPALLIGAAISVALMRSGFLAFFFLCPLGFVAAVYGRPSAWGASVLAAVMDLILLSIVIFHAGGTFGDALPGFVYFAVMILLFLWIMAPPFSGPAVLRVRTACRFAGASVIAALTLFLMVFASGDGGGFFAFLRAQAEVISALFVSSAGADTARRALLEETASPGRIMEFIQSISLRGGAVASCMLLFFINHQLSLTGAGMVWRRRLAAAVARGERGPQGPKDDPADTRNSSGPKNFNATRGAGGLRSFHLPGSVIWILSFSILAVVLTEITGLSVPGIAAWNAFVICGLMYLAQGAGIVLYFLSRRGPLMRLAMNILIAVMIFSPGINAFALGVLVLLGIAENWLPLRAPKTDGSVPTPGP
ncbi:MAG: YybS family protein [Treponema sp.]|jgi:hypothetical protein|nr:YybS family protein [Treponema sp.]